MEIRDGFEDLSIPRYVGFSPVEETELHIFVDASAKAYAAVAYLRHNDGEHANVHLLFSKSRLAPVKQKITIPRLELLAVLIGSRMITFLLKQMKLSSSKCVLWTDSECCLHWLKTTKPLARFVENRIKEIKGIQNSIPGAMVFNFVSGKENPADLATRGTSFLELKSDRLWWP